MKKFLALVFMVFLAAGVYADNNAYFNAGTSNGTQLTVSAGKWVEIPLWVTGEVGTVDIGSIACALGIQVARLDTLYPGLLYYPVSAWAILTFDGYNDDITDPDHPNPTGYRSLTFLGWARDITHTTNPLLYGTGVPIKSFSFMVHTEDTVLAGQTFPDLLMPGQDPVQGPPNTGDSTGSGGFPVVFTGCPIFFSPNEEPDIIDESVVMPYDCGYTDFSIFVEIFDNDGDPLTVTTNYGIPTLFATDGEPGEPTTYTYKIDFDMEVFCGDCATFFLEITADDGVNDPVVFTDETEVTIIGEIVASMDNALYIWPGLEDWMNVYLDACGYCFCLGGFVFSIEYDPSVLTITDVERGVALAGGEYWNVIYNFDGPGTIRVVFMNDLNNQTPVQDICDLDPDAYLFRLKFLLAVPDYPYPANFCIPICFMWDQPGENHYDFNNVSDPDGYHVWMNDACLDNPDSSEYGTMLLTMECGNIKVMDEHNVMIGDINLNGYQFEVGDAVLLANHLMDPVAFPFTLRQMFASNVNGDQYQASIGDLIYMINDLNGGGKVTPLDVVATVAMPADASGNVDVTISSEVNVGGALVTINHTGVELGAPTVDGMILGYSDNGDVMTVLVYGEKDVSFAPGTNVLFTVPVLGEGTISFGEVSVSDNRGAMLSGRVSYEAALPTEFAVAQNYPNPFNAKTSFRLNVPVESDLTVNIYNVAGQLVKAMDMHLIAGVHSVVWDASDVASGVYFYKVTADDFTKTMKMTLLK